MNPAISFGARALATCFFLTVPIESFSRKRGWKLTGSGFIGTLAGVACAPFLPQQAFLCAIVLLGVILVSAVISDVAETDMGRKDDQRIVIDEWAGYLISVAFLPPTAFVLIGGFVLFRVLDSLKPLGIGRLGSLPGGWGVLLDDVAAGILTNGVLQIVHRVM